MSGPLLLAIGALVASWVFTGWVRRYALRSSMLDLPSRRGSHLVPTPRGGGLAIAITVLGGIAVAGAAGWVPTTVVIALGGGGLMIAAIGWIDDRRGAALPVRFAVQLGAAAWALFWLGGLEKLGTGLGPIWLGPMGTVIGLLGLIWATNCYNFMDGIDGLAGGEAVTVGVAGALLLLLSGHRDLATIALLIGAASAGFLVWNWAPARIFMGDVGSGLLGFLFGALAVASERSGALPLLGWILLLGVFEFDATVTLIRRMWRGERWYEAHQTHAYQRAVQSGWSHARVAGSILSMNVGLAGLVWVGWRWPSLWLATSLCALTGLTAVYLKVQSIWASRAAAGNG